MLTKKHSAKMVPVSPKVGKFCPWELSWGPSPRLSPSQRAPLSTISKWGEGFLRAGAKPFATLAAHRPGGHDTACLPRKLRN